MAAIVKSWIRAYCDRCTKRRVFVLQTGWILVCAECGCEKRLQENGLLAASA